MALDNALIRLRAKAKKAGVPNYGQMSRSELQSALKGGTSKRKSASAVSKRKSATTVGRKATGRKPARKATTAVAKRKPGRPKGSGSKPSRAKGFAAAKKTTRASSNGDAGRNQIDVSNVDWSAEWTGGTRGNRAIIMKALRRFKGNRAKVVKHLEGNAQKMFAKSSKDGHKYNKAEAMNLLKWYISRVAFDFVTGTGQHEIATNRKPDKRTHGSRGGARKSAPKSRTSKPKAKPGRKPAARKTSAQGRKPGRPKGSKNKRTTGKARRTVKR
jgi:hypothetical protein